MRSLLLIPVLLLPCAAAAQTEPDLGTQQQRENGRQIYMEKCAQCHGEDGRGEGIAAPFLQPAPRDFTAGIFKVRTTPSGQLPTDDDLKRIIKNGMPYTGMPAWPSLNDNQIRDLVYFIKTFNDDFAGPYGVPDLVEIPKPPGFSTESAERGRQVYEENQCADCHGDQGRGDGPSAPTLTDQWDNHIRPADLTKRWTFIGGSSRQDIYRTFMTGLDGSPMPSYSIDPVEDRWALVDYVYSLSEDEIDYSTVVVARGVDGPIDISQGKALFGDERPAIFPVVGQVIQPGRSFMPGVDAIEVKAVYNQDEIAVMLSWHDMIAERRGSNSPAMAVAAADSAGAMAEARVVRDTTASIYSDAVAVQIPSSPTEGQERPYFLFGDAKKSVDLWFADLAKSAAEMYVGRSHSDVVPGTDSLEFYADYQDGEWVVIFKRNRVKEGGTSFEEGTFVPIAFSVWDGFNDEHGNRRGITSWYHLYMEPIDKPSALIPMLKWGLITLLVQLLIIGLVRWRSRKPVAAL